MKGFCKCGDPISRQRIDLGYKTCTVCGEIEAAKETAEKAAAIVPSYHKGGMSYVSPESRADYVKGVNKIVQVSNDVSTIPYDWVHRKKPPPVKRKVVGYNRVNGEIVVIFDKPPPKRRGDYD